MEQKNIEVVVDDNIKKTTFMENEVDIAQGADEVIIEQQKDVQPSNNEEEKDGTMNLTQFAINLMKGIAGTGSLAVPLAIRSSGMIWGVFLLGLVAFFYIYSSYQLVTLNDNIGSKKNIIKSDSDYAKICYVVLGKVGYYVFNFSFLLTLYGAAVGNMIAMCDFMTSIPYMDDQPALKRLIVQCIITLVCIVFSMLKDPSLLVAISSFGLAALVISFIVLLGYGFSTSHLTFENSYLWPTSTRDILNNLGIFVYSLAFTEYVLPQGKFVKKVYKGGIFKTVAKAAVTMGIIYYAIGVVCYMLYENTENGVQGNILLSLPSYHWGTYLTSGLMVVTIIGSFPLCMGPIHEVVEVFYKEIKTNKYFIVNKECWIFRSVEIVLISVIAYLVPSFSDILSFNILFYFVEWKSFIVYLAISLLS